MKKIFAITLTFALLAIVATSCANEAKHKYEAQKAVVDSIQTVGMQNLNGALLNESGTGALNEKLKYYHEEAVALDSLKNLAKEAFGDNSAEYKEAYDQYIKAKEKEESSTDDALESLKNFTH